MTNEDILTKNENTLYILENLASTESADLDYAEIDVYYELEDGQEAAAQFDMPTIADRAIETIKEQQNRIAELEKEVDKYRLEATRQYGAYCALLFSNVEPSVSLEAHNLEQQAKGVKDFVANYCGDRMDFSQADRRIENLHNQANQLRAEVGTLQGGDE